MVPPFRIGVMSSKSARNNSPEGQRSRFEWQEVEHGLWERDIDECEMFYVHSATKGRSFFPLTGCVSFKTRPLFAIRASVATHNVQDALRKAWLMLSRSHPTLISQVEHEKATGRWKRVYREFEDEHEEERWLASTFKVINTDLDPVEWYNKGMPFVDAATIFLVDSTQGNPPQKTVFLQCPHDITDGIGILQLLDQLFHQAAQALKQGPYYVPARLGDVYTRLSPCLRIAASIPDITDGIHGKLFKDIQAQNQALYTHNGLLGIPPSSNNVDSDYRIVRRTSLALSRTDSKAILRSCKDIAPGVSLTHVFMSALALALRDLRPQRDEPYPVRYVNHSMINLRPYCHQPYRSADHAAAAYHAVSAQALALDLEVPRSSQSRNIEIEHLQLPQLAASVRDFYKAIRPVAAAEVHEQVMLAPMMFKSITPPTDTDPHSVSKPLFCSVALSSIGNIDSFVASKYGPFELTNVWVGSEPIGAGVALFIGSWGGEIGLSGVYNTRYHDEDYIGRFLVNIIDKVRGGLGLCSNAHIHKIAVTTKITSESKKRKQIHSEGIRTEDDASLGGTKARRRYNLQENSSLSNV